MGNSNVQYREHDHVGFCEHTLYINCQVLNLDTVLSTVFKQPQRSKSFELGAYIQGWYHDGPPGRELLGGTMMKAFPKTVGIWVWRLQ